MKSEKYEFIWSGKVHLGDEPGIYGNAQYSGLYVENPITIKTLTLPQSEEVTITVSAKDVKTYAPYKGHKITIYRLNATKEDPLKWEKKIITTSRTTKSGSINIKFPFEALNSKKNYVSIAIEIDTEVAAGLYDDFLITEISFNVPNYKYYVPFGFEYDD